MSLSAGHILILLTVLLLLGGHRLPALGTQLGKAVRAFKKLKKG